MITVRGPSVLLFVVEVHKEEPEPAPTLYHGSVVKTVMVKIPPSETVIPILVTVTEKTVRDRVVSYPKEIQRILSLYPK